MVSISAMIAIPSDICAAILTWMKSKFIWLLHLLQRNTDVQKQHTINHVRNQG